MSDENIFRGGRRNSKPCMLGIAVLTMALGISADLFRNDTGLLPGQMDDLSFESAGNATVTQTQPRQSAGAPTFHLIRPENIEVRNGVPTVVTWYLVADNHTQWTVSSSRITVPAGQEYSTNMFFKWSHGRFCQIK